MENKKGWPIYLDEAKRNLADPTIEEAEVNSWYPSNKPSQLLWRCFDLLKDIGNLLQGTALLSESELRRRCKAIVTPLYSLCVAIKDLFNYLSSPPEHNDKLTREQKSDIKKQKSHYSKLLNEFLKAVPLDKTSAIRGVRDKLSAHADKLMPYEVTAILNKAQNYQIGTWLHECIIALGRLIPIPDCGWTTDDCPEGYVRFVSVEPWLITFKLDEEGKINRMVETNIVSSSPQNQVLETCYEVVKNSQRMFRPEDPRLIFTGETLELQEPSR